MPPAPNPPPSSAQPARAPIRLTAQVLTCAVFSLCALVIIYLAQAQPRAVFQGPLPVGTQVVYGLGLSALAALVSYASFRLTAGSEATNNTIIAYGRLDLSGRNPVWISLAAAIGEELLFRAALQPLLGIWIASLLFLLTHTPVYQFRKLDAATLVQAGGVFGASVALGLIYQHVGLLAAMMAHAAFDVVGLYVVRIVLRARR